ncbi:MAG: hypothetical protein LBR80_01730 [Deltaproteobacteria bacterium]|nr:hypothetical protein [Deltaproteobacteria bacterium]
MIALSPNNGHVDASALARTEIPYLDAVIDPAGIDFLRAEDPDQLTDPDARKLWKGGGPTYQTLRRQILDRVCTHAAHGGLSIYLDGDLMVPVRHGAAWTLYTEAELAGAAV